MAGLDPAFRHLPVAHRARSDFALVVKFSRAAQDTSITVLDVRPAQEFAAGHLPGAINIPFDDLQRRLGELPANAEIAAYCRGPYCLMARDAVLLLKQQGFEAIHLPEGVAEWGMAPVR